MSEFQREIDAINAKYLEIDDALLSEAIDDSRYSADEDSVLRAVLADSSPARPPSAEQDAQVRAPDDPVIIEVSGCAC